MTVSVYLDTCSIQRPLDKLDQTRLRLEAEAMLGVFAVVQTGKVALISSTVLEIEVLQNPFVVRLQHGRHVLSQASTIIKVDDTLANRAATLVQEGVKPMDALHLACAEAAEADYFCTCDDQPLRRTRAIADLNVAVIVPVELVEVLEQ